MSRDLSIVEQMIAKARVAQAEWAKADQVRIDSVVREIARTVYDNADCLARKTVEETQLGTFEFNLSQDKRKSEILWYSLKGKKSVGIINHIEEQGLVEIAKPIGIVGVVLPVTIPVTNFMSNGMFALKCGNAVIYAPHPKAKKTVATTAKMVLEALAKFDIPENLIQYIEEPTIELTRELMAAVDVVVATGGMPMVKAAYSSGRPAYGVGPGNVQAIIDSDADVEDSVKKIVASRVFNLGIPCACEQAVHVPKENFESIVECFKTNKVHYVEDREQILRIQITVFDEKGDLRRDCIGISAIDVAKKAGISVPKDTEVLMLKGSVKDYDRVLRKEKLCPVMLIFAYESFDEAIELANGNLELNGKGHSGVIHSHTKEHIEKFAASHPVSRIIVNQACNFAAGGGFTIGFAPTTTLGCGSWGNNAISENLTYKHLMNITRIGYPLPASKIPTSEQVWGS